MTSLLILLPLFFVVFLNLPIKIIEKISFKLAAVLILFQIIMVISDKYLFWSSLPDPLGPFFSFKLSVDALSFVLVLSIGIICLAVLFVGEYTIGNEQQRFNFINIILISMAAMNAVVMARGLFCLYMFIEITSVSSFILISLEKDRRALSAAFKYIMFSVVASVLMLSAIALFLLIAGDMGFIQVYGACGDPSNIFLAKFAAGLFICGLLIKSGIMPFHGWLPDTYTSAPSSVSVLLAGIVTKASGVYALIRLVISAFGYTEALKSIFMFLGAVSIIAGALAAFGQCNFKRMLAYSSISQAGYIILALGCGTKLGIAGAVLHLFNHAIFKSLLFTNGAVLEQRLGTVDMDRMGGVASKMPITGLTSVIGLLGTAGIPPLSGFWSKLIIVIALWQSGNIVYAVIAVMASLLTLAYFLSMQRRVFFGELAIGLSDVHEAGIGLIIPQVFLALIVVLTGVFFPIVYNTFIIAVQELLR